MKEASDTRPLITTKTFKLEGGRIALGLMPKAVWGALPGAGIVIAGISIKKSHPEDLVVASTLIWAGAALILCCIAAPFLANLMAAVLPRPSQRVEFYTHELDVVLTEGASRSIPYVSVEAMWEEGQSLCLEIAGETLEIPHLAFQTRWEMERAQSLIKAMRPDQTLRSLAS